MASSGKPKVFISYTWLDQKGPDGRQVRVPDQRAFDLAERLRKEAGFDSRLDLYFRDSYYGFEPPELVPSDNRNPWIIWAEEQIRNADCVLLFCTSEYVASDPNRGECPGQWCNWHQLDDESKLNTSVPFLWWDWHHIAQECKTEPQKFIPVGVGPYDSECVPAFVRGAAYCNVDSTKEFEGLARRIRRVYLRRYPRKGVFISYAHKKNDQKWLDSLLGYMAFLKRQGVEIWTDRDIKPGDEWHSEIQSALLKAKVAVLLVTPAFLASTYIANHELPNILQAAKSEGLVIFWIPVEPSGYKQSPIAQFEAAYPPSDPLFKLQGAKRGEAFVSIASKLADAVGVNKTNTP